MEVELKLGLDPADTTRLRTASVLAGVRPVTREMDALYLDTPRRELRRSQMVLRIRRSGARWMQCLKAGASGTGGLHARDEWEYERPRAEVDLALFRDTPLAQLASVDTLHERLAPAFRVTFDRTAWLVEPAPGTRLEVSLDVGEVRSGKRCEPICEVEIECLEGDAALVFELALRLLDAVTLRPSPVTKAQRGYRLCSGKAMRPVRAQPARVSCDMTPAAAAAAIVSAGLEQLQGNEEGLLHTGEAEFVHQARVALRRMRGALRMFRKPIGARRADAWHEELAQAARTLGEARDWDVFVTDTLPALLRASRRAEAALSTRAAARQAGARGAAREAVRSPRYARAMIEISQWLAQSPGESGDGALEDFAARLLAKRHKRLAAGLDALAAATAEQRHRVRIDAKRLRYAVEGLAPALDAVAARRYARRLSDLQDVLGRANDAVAGERLLAELRPRAPLASFAKKWLHARTEAERPALARLAAESSASRPFWRHP